MLCRYTARAGTNALLSGSARAQSLTRAPTRLVAAAATLTATPTTTHRAALAAFRSNAIALPTKRYFSLFGSSDKTSDEAAPNEDASNEDALGKDVSNERASNDHRPGFAHIGAKKLTLWAPWEVRHLRPVEQEAYRTHGADYVKHLDIKDARTALKDARGRWARERHMRERHGDDLWFQVEEELTRRWPGLEAETMESFHRRREALDLKEAEGLTEKSKIDEGRRQLSKDRTDYHKIRDDKKIKHEYEIRAELEQKLS